jgi:hypothetical protein
MTVTGDAGSPTAADIERTASKQVLMTAENA